MHSKLKSIHFNIRESIFLKIWIQFQFIWVIFHFDQGRSMFYIYIYVCVCVYTRTYYIPANENGLKFFSIRMRILNSEYFCLNLIGFNWMQLDWKIAFKILNWTSIHNVLCTEKANIIFRLKGIEICSVQFL